MMNRSSDSNIPKFQYSIIPFNQGLKEDKR